MSRRFGLFPVRSMWYGSRLGIVLIIALSLVGLSRSALAQGGTPDVTIEKGAFPLNAFPGEYVTYILLLENAGPGSALVSMFDILPFGVVFDQIVFSSPPAAVYVAAPQARVIWNGTITEGATAEIVFRVRVVEPGTGGPLPILNTACADGGGGRVCDSITVYSSRFVYLPFIGTQPILRSQ